MTQLNNQSENIRKVLATDLDGTFIPLPDSPENIQALHKLSNAETSGKFKLIFCTGRHYLSVEDAMIQYSLPRPDWIICDVGTSIYRNSPDGYHIVDAYSQHLSGITGHSSRENVESLLEGLQGLHLQIEDHQQPFKISFECESPLTDDLVGRISRLLHDFKLPYETMGSIDPFLDCGLIDILPKEVNKSYALAWLAEFAGYKTTNVIYAGDSGNDYAALTSGVKAILVANASKRLAGRVKKKLKSQNQSSRLFLATKKATSGVLEGCEHFGLL